MTTKAEMVAIIKAENLDGLRVGNEVDGYTQLTAAQFDTQIAEWAENRLAKQALLKSLDELKIARQALLHKLGITAEEAALLLGQ